MAQVSVVIGTLNRSAQLERALQSLVAQRCPVDLFEVLVIDNGSVDDSARTVARVAARAPHVRYIAEPRLGLSIARNRGIDAAAGDLVAFLDDDAEADPEWVPRLVDLFRSNPGIGAAGGRTVVRWPQARPAWVCANLEAYYGKCDYGDARRDLAFPDYPFGSNMAFRRLLLRDVGGFRAELGARGGNLMAGEETDLFERLHARHVRVLYDPSLLVHHWPAPERITRAWSLRRSFKHGLSSSRMRFVNGERGWRNWAGPLLRAVQRSTVGALATATAVAAYRDGATVMSRGSNATYWAGFARGALSNALGRDLPARDERARTVDPRIARSTRIVNR
jgi:glycosyltransferase involved in cell wall biosynthesis